MGQSNNSSMMGNLPEHVLSQQEFGDLIQNTRRKTAFHDQMVKNNKYPVIFICDKETDEDRMDEGYKENCEIDSISADYVNRYYVAQLKTVRRKHYSDFSSLLHDNYHTNWSYGFDVYEYHKLDSNYKRLMVKDYYFCDIQERTKNFGTHMSNDLITILQIIKSFNRDRLEEQIMAAINEQLRLRDIADINTKYGHGHVK